MGMENNTPTPTILEDLETQSCRSYIKISCSLRASTMTERSNQSYLRVWNRCIGELQEPTVRARQKQYLHQLTQDHDCILGGCRGDDLGRPGG